jgi:hypothetical protein
MCLIIDTCTFASVFDEHCREYSRFAPIVEWLTTGNGKIIFGGSKYKHEIRGSKFLRILTEFERKGKLVRVSDAKVDRLARELKRRVPERAFNDEHLVALVSITRCCVVCTDDKAAVPYLKRRDLYPRGVKPPKIYRHKAHASLCRSEHIVSACR